MISAIGAFTVAGRSLLRNRNEELWIGRKGGKHAKECSLLRIKLQDLFSESTAHVQDVIADGNGTCSTESAIAGLHKLTDVAGFNN